ncbi:MAG: NUDIX hydrolase [Candidatus Woesearchaeota archaeon]
MKEKKQRIIVKGIVLKDNKLLLVKRKRKGHEIDNKWELPGGKIDFGEKMEDACQREIQEEAGVLTKFKKIDIVNYQNIFFDGVHYSHLILIPILFDYQKEDINYKGDHNVYEVNWFNSQDIKQLDLIDDNKKLIEGVLKWKLG